MSFMSIKFLEVMDICVRSGLEGQASAEATPRSHGGAVGTGAFRSLTRAASVKELSCSVGQKLAPVYPSA